MTVTISENTYKRFRPPLSVIILATALGLGACTDNGGQKDAQDTKSQEIEKTVSAGNEASTKSNRTEDAVVAESPATTEEQVALQPVDAMQSILKPGYRLKMSNGNAAVFAGQAGQPSDVADLMDDGGNKRGRALFLVQDGKLVILDDPSMLPEEGFAFLPYYTNTGGTANLLMLGLFQVKDGEVAETDVIDIDDRAEFVNLEYLGEGQYRLHARTRGMEQSPAEAPNVPLEILFQRSESKMIDRQAKVSGPGAQGAAKDQPADEQGVNDQQGHALPGLTDSGFGPLTADSRYDANSLAAYTNGQTETYEVTHIDNAQAEFGEISVVKLSGQTGAIKATYLKDGALVSVDVTLAAVATSNNVKLGDNLPSAIAAHGGSSLCGTGLEELSGNVVCVFDGMKHLATVFGGPTPDNVPDGWFPEPGSAEAKQWVAVSHVWLDNPMAHMEPFGR